MKKSFADKINKRQDPRSLVAKAKAIRQSVEDVCKLDPNGRDSMVRILDKIYDRLEFFEYAIDLSSFRRYRSKFRATSSKAFMVEAARAYAMGRKTYLRLLTRLKVIHPHRGNYWLDSKLDRIRHNHDNTTKILAGLDSQK